MVETSSPIEVAPPQKKSVKGSLLPGILGVFLLTTIVLVVLGSIRPRTPNPQASPDTSSTAPKGQLTLDPRLTKSLSHLTDDERATWREQSGEVVRYSLRYPTDFSLDDQGMYGAVLLRTTSIPTFDGKVTSAPSPNNFLYFHALPLQQTDGMMKSVSKDFDADWASFMNQTDVEQGISLKDSESYQSARKELDTLLKMKVGEKGSLYTRVDDTSFNTVTANTYITHSRIPGYPAETKEIRFLVDTDTLTYVFGGYIGGKNVKETESISEESLRKIFNTLILQ